MIFYRVYRVQGKWISWVVTACIGFGVSAFRGFYRVYRV